MSKKACKDKKVKVKENKARFFCKKCNKYAKKKKSLCKPEKMAS